MSEGHPALMRPARVRPGREPQRPGRDRRAPWPLPRAGRESRRHSKVRSTVRPSNTDKSSAAFAVLFARAVVGLIFFMAGVWKVFTLGPAAHVRKYFLPFQDTFLPVWSLWLTGFTIPFIELIAGALVIIGLKTRYALVALGTVLVIVTFGHLLENPLYPFHEHVIPRLVLVVFVLMVPAEADRYSLDAFFRSRQHVSNR